MFVFTIGYVDLIVSDFQQQSEDEPVFMKLTLLSNLNEGGYLVR